MNQTLASLPHRRAAHLCRLILPVLLCFFLTSCETLGLPAPSWPSSSGGGFARVDDPMAAQAVPAAQPGSGAVNCVVGHGAARFTRGWYDFEETRFTLRDEQRVNVALRRSRSGDSMMFQGVLDNAGQKILFCPVRSGPPDQRIICASLYMLEDDLQAGVKRTFDIPDAVRGGTISCAYDRARLLKL
ncbi:MAG: hypothetical protein Q8K65_02115 [Alphaproteobacteria bacterium]|nr:hypothetical protein [Alphaproteobacteria bacterium]